MWLKDPNQTLNPKTRVWGSKLLEAEFRVYRVQISLVLVIDIGLRAQPMLLVWLQ